ncbi:MAG: 3,4-dihydroxy 2-butanone 4-phosphate synthase / cyclohydrolase [Alphaproteobacteria bacterium]|jgi:GTP cyclohydrolase II|nr:3,4-dihydroxy 2-butanone 4-phosphate synthase / cyclohydrolase [Alphaproteobacteria bacterium]
MTTALSDPIDLKTGFGSFKAYHLSSNSRVGPGEQGRDGMVVSSIKGKDIAASILVRMQSSCLFSEAFQSQDCDCALQLISSLGLISREEGIIIYYYDEGRGMGLELKFKAIRLQQLRGIDSITACRELNISVDSRSYTGAADVIRFLAGNRPIVLLSNNPEKEKSLCGQGLKIVARQPCYAVSTILILQSIWMRSDESSVMTFRGYKRTDVRVESCGNARWRVSVARPHCHPCFAFNRAHNRPRWG